MTHNIGSAMLILGVIYLATVHGFNGFFALLLVLLAAGTWGYHGFSDERKNKFKAEIHYWEAKAGYYEAKSKQLSEMRVNDGASKRGRTRNK